MSVVAPFEISALFKSLPPSVVGMEGRKSQN
jgi:hypothetical protein